MGIEETELKRFESEMNDRIRKFVMDTINQALQYGMSKELISNEAFLCYLYGAASVKLSSDLVKGEDLEEFKKFKEMLEPFVRGTEDLSIGRK